jgi:hypothetical protein
MKQNDGGLRVLFRKHLPQVHWTTIESRFTESGIPDLNGCLDGVEFWLECKLARGWKIVVRPSQISWMSRRIRCGGRCFVAVRRKTKSADEFWLFHGADILTLRTQGIAHVTPIIVWGDGPTRWPWGSIGAALVQVGQPGHRGQPAPLPVGVAKAKQGGRQPGHPLRAGH